METFITQSAIAIVSLVVGTLLGQAIARYMYRPKVIIRYKNIMPLVATDGVFWAIEIANLGKSVARNCIGTITLRNVTEKDIVPIYDADPDESLPEYPEEKLDIEYPREQILADDSFRRVSNTATAWARLGNPFQMNINPGMSEQLDLCKVHYSKKGIYALFPSEFGWRRLRLRTNKEHILGRIMICPENDFPTPINFEIRLNTENGPLLEIHKLSFIERLIKTFRKEYYYFE